MLGKIVIALVLIPLCLVGIVAVLGLGMFTVAPVPVQEVNTIQVDQYNQPIDLLPNVPYVSSAPRASWSGVLGGFGVIVGIAVGVLVSALGIAVVRLFRSGKDTDTGDDGYGQSDTQLIQDLHRTATQIEARVEALETIMLERTDAHAASAVSHTGANS